MPAATHNLLIEQGSNFSIIFQYLDSLTNPIDISKYCIRLRFRDVENTSRVALYSSQTANASYILRSLGSGQIEWSLPYTETETFNFNTAVYDLELIDENYERIRICTGNIQILKNNFSDCDENNPNSIASGWCAACSDISVYDSWGKIISPTVYIPAQLQEDELCNYLCRNMDVFSKLYTSKTNLYHVDGITSGTIPLSSGQTTFELPIDYVADSINLTLNSSQLLKDVDFITSQSRSIRIVSLDINDGDTITWTHAGLFIQDNFYNSCGINIPDSGIVTNIDVTISNLKHPNPQDFSLILSPPSGNPILLSAYNKINNYSLYSGINFTFSNKATQNIYLNNRNIEDLYVNILNKTDIYKLPNTLYVSPSTDDFPSRVINSGVKFSSSLSSLTGISPYGNWFLIAYDHDIGSSGIIESWSLAITYQPTISILE